MLPPLAVLGVQAVRVVGLPKRSDNAKILMACKDWDTLHPRRKFPARCLPNPSSFMRILQVGFFSKTFWVEPYAGIWCWPNPFWQLEAPAVLHRQYYIDKYRDDILAWNEGRNKTCILFPSNPTSGGIMHYKVCYHHLPPFHGKCRKPSRFSLGTGCLFYRVYAYHLPSMHARDQKAPAITTNFPCISRS
jgi:hypothetical protein